MSSLEELSGFVVGVHESGYTQDLLHSKIPEQKGHGVRDARCHV